MKTLVVAIVLLFCFERCSDNRIVCQDNALPTSHCISTEKFNDQIADKDITIVYEHHGLVQR